MTRDAWDADPIPADLALAAGGDPPPDDDEIDLYMAAQEADPDVDPRGQVVERVAAYRLDDDDHAEYYMRRMAETEVVLRDVSARAAAWKAQVDDWARRQITAVERRRGWWIAHLADYAVRRRIARLKVDPKDPKAKTLDLPSGKVSTSHKQPAARITDPDAVVRWLKMRAREHRVNALTEGWIVVETRPVVAGVKKLLTIKGDDEHGYEALCDGKPVPGVTVEGEDITATVKPGP